MLSAELEALVHRVERDSGSAARLSPRSLSGLLAAVAAVPQLWRSCVRHEVDRRWYGSLYRDDVVDLWLLSWQQDNATELHDHGGSSGAFRVLDGALSEDRPACGGSGSWELRRERRETGQTVAFGPRLVHDVRNTAVAPAVSLHVYSPPLTSMTYYDLTHGGLVAQRCEPVDVRPSDGPVPGRALTVDA